MAVTEGDLVTRLLQQSILTLCREAVAFRSRLEVDGLICLTVDDQDQHVVKIHECFDKNSETPYSSKGSVSRERRASSSRTIIRYAPNAKTEKEAPNRNIQGIENVPIKSEPIDDTDSIIDVSPHVDVAQNPDDSPQEGSHRNHTVVDRLTSLDYSSIGLNNLIISSAKNILCKKCNSFLENVGLFQEHNMTSHGQFTCLVCLATFTSRNNMKRHIRLHTGIKPYSCHKCPESFSRNDDYKRHLLKHTFQKPFRCALCSTGYSDRSCVKNHMIKDHNSKLFHICPQCGESYIDLQKFQQHKKCHPEFQDYRCSLCSFTGSNALMYNKHMLTHGPLREYKCTHCNISYSDPFMYTGHIKKHKGDELAQSFTCCFCDMSLPSFEQFQRHEHTHVHSKQHICNQCNKVFRYPSNLREHMLIHLSQSGLSAKNNQAQHSKNVDGTQHDRQGNNATKTIVEQRNFAEPMATNEENNNTINLFKHADTQSPDRDDIGGSNEYWCTECNQGFETENKLKKHITHKHEEGELEMKDDGKKTAEDYQNTNQITEQKVTETQAELHTNIYDGHITEENRNQSVSDALTVFDGKQKEDVTFNNDVDNSADMMYNYVSLNNVSSNPDKISKNKLHTVTDDMKEVQNVQFRFGIKPAGLDTLGSDVKDLQIRSTEDDFAVERSNSLSSPSNITVTTKTSRKPERGISVSDTSMKMKIQRTSRTLTENFSKPHVRTDQKKNTSSDHFSQSPEMGKDTVGHGAPNQRPATTLNLQVRNPGFERVVTPQVLFSTKAPFTCEVCEETFGSFDDFHEHGVKVHRRFICSFCGKVFTSRPNRERHIRYHTGEKPYKCDLCTATFLRGDDLKYHRTTKHADIKPFTCGACQISFSLPKDLEKHLKIYSDHRL